MSCLRQSGVGSQARTLCGVGTIRRWLPWCSGSVPCGPRPSPRAATEQEALAAAEKAAELLDRYGLSLSELEFRAQPCDGIGIQTNRRRFAPITPAAREAAAAVEHAGGVPDLHCMAAWEILTVLRTVIERVGPDRQAIRDALASLETMPGLLGTIQRTPDRESKKPYVFVQVHNGQWIVRSQSLTQ